MATKPTLSREYLFVPFTDMNFDVSDLDVHEMAFKAAGVEPAEVDWIEAIKVDSGHALYQASIGEGLALLIGPTRGDAVTTNNLALGDYQVWIDAAVPSSDERVVRVAGVLSITQSGA